jgi:hypothetical protein
MTPHYTRYCVVAQRLSVSDKRVYRIMGYLYGAGGSGNLIRCTLVVYILYSLYYYIQYYFSYCHNTFL